MCSVRSLGEQQPLEPTDRHRLFSATRNAWVPASELAVGEELTTRSGAVRVDSVNTRSGTQRVYNIEVEGEHCYYAGELEVLSHNTCAAETTPVWPKTAEEMNAFLKVEGKAIPDTPTTPGRNKTVSDPI